MNRLANALAFAAVVLGMFALEARQRWPQYTPSQLIACAQRSLHLAPTARSNDLPSVASLENIPQIDEEQLDRVMDRASVGEVRFERAMQRSEAARQRVIQVQMRRAAERANHQVQRATSRCTVVRFDR